MKLPEELRHASGGEAIDSAAQDAVRLAYRALERFPDLVRKHKFIAGGAAVSSALVALAGVAITRRMGNGESADEAVDAVTEQELTGLRVVEATEELTVTGDAPTNGASSDDASDDGSGDAVDVAEASLVEQALAEGGDEALPETPRSA